MGIIGGVKNRAYLLAAHILLWWLEQRKRSLVFFVLAIFFVVIYGVGFGDVEPAEAGVRSKLLKGLAGLGVGIFAGRVIGGVAEDFMNSLVMFFATRAFALVNTLIVSAAIAINALLAAFVSFAKSLMETALTISLTVPYTSGGVIDAVWPVLRDLANMSLILILLAIGIGTMLNLNSGSWRKLLPIFVIVALLINFTPFLTGIFIDISNVTTRAFFDGAVNTGNVFMAANPFMGDLLQKVLGVGEIIGSVFTGDIDIAGQLAILVLAVSSILMNILVIFGFLVVAFLLIMRIFALWFLVIISPLAAVAYILPKTKKYFQRWWRNFFRWSIIAIPLVFSLWVAGMFANNNICALVTDEELGTTVESKVDEVTTANNEQAGLKEVLNPEPLEEGALPEDEFVKGGLYGDIFGVVNNASVVCGATTMLFALAALYVGVWGSIHTSAEGAGFITSRAAKIQKATIKGTNDFLKRQRRQRIEAPVAGAAGRAAAGYGGRIPMIGGAFRTLGMRGMSAQRKAQQDELKKFQGRFSGLEKKDFGTVSAGFKKMGMQERAAFISAWDKKDKEAAGDFFFSKKAGLTDEQREKILQTMSVAAKQNPAMESLLKDFYKHNPHLTEDVAKAVRKLNEGDLEKLTTEALKQDELLKIIQTQGRETQELVRNWARDPEKAKVLGKFFKESMYQEMGIKPSDLANLNPEELRGFENLMQETRKERGGRKKTTSEFQANMQDDPWIAAELATIPRRNKQQQNTKMRQEIVEEIEQKENKN